MDKLDVKGIRCDQPWGWVRLTPPLTLWARVWATTGTGVFARVNAFGDMRCDSPYPAWPPRAESLQFPEKCRPDRGGIEQAQIPGSGRDALDQGCHGLTCRRMD